MSKLVLNPDQVITYLSINGVNLKLHLFKPAQGKTGDLPAIIFFFGGGWETGDIKQFYRQARYLSFRGMMSICADYRVNTRHQVDPRECVKDARSAMRYLKSHAKELGIDPQRIVAGGGSAGAHIAACCSTTDKFNNTGDDLSLNPCPFALVLFNPVYDNGPGGFGHDKVKEYWQDFSPLHNISIKMPPAIVLAGDDDELISVQVMNKFRDKMKNLGIRSELVIYKDRGHGFFNNECFYETLEEVDRFLISLEILQGQPRPEVIRSLPKDRTIDREDKMTFAKEQI